MSGRRKLFGKLNLGLFRAIESATTFAKLRGNPYVELVHWLHQLWQVPSGDLHLIAEEFDIDREQVEKDLVVALSALPAGASGINDFSHHIELAIERAWLVASISMGDNRVRGAWLVAAMLQNTELRRLLISISPAFQKIQPIGLLEILPSIVANSRENEEKSYEGADLIQSMPGEASAAGNFEAENHQSVLVKYCLDLTEQAKLGKIDPVLGREHEIRTLVDILLRRRQNNPLLTGEAGVGKTAVVEGLALAIVAGLVPPQLVSVRLLTLDVGALLAGASMRGEFESRLKSVLQEASQSERAIIIFIDEVHTLVGAGGAAGTGDAANLLKPALARGNLRTIGATTWTEYKKHIEKDPALTRRFQVLQVMEPQEAQAIDMVRGLVPAFTKHHGVVILDEAIRAAVTLSHRYIPARQLPDKAISLLDTACARVAMSMHVPPAKIEYLRQQIDSLNAEKSMLLNESNIGKEREEGLQKVQAQLSKLQAELVTQTKEWQVELEQVTQILILRQKIQNPAQEERSSDLSVDTEEGESPDALNQKNELRILEKELALTQGQSPIIYPQVDESVIASIVADWTGIPAGKMVRDEALAVLELREQLERRVVGQRGAIEQLVERVKTAKAKLADPGKPIGVFMLVGPSGVGKTETALALAEAVYGGEHNLITINMSEYQEAHTVSSLKGSPPGYVGYGEGGVLTEAVRKKPYSVILLDEVEKAHSDVHEVFYQVFDKGWMEDGEGRAINFKNTLILLTSNSGADLISQMCDDPTLIPTKETIIDALQPELRKVFPAAFLGRLSIIPYLPLSKQILANIAQIQLQKIVTRLNDQHQINLDYSAEVVSKIVEVCGTHETGARRLGQFIENHIVPKLAQFWLEAVQDKTKIQSIKIYVQGEDKDKDREERQISDMSKFYLVKIINEEHGFKCELCF